MRSVTGKLMIGLAILVVLVPLGVIVPRFFNAGEAWGEWGTETIEKLVGYLPAGFKWTAHLWRAPVPGYGLGPESASTAAVGPLCSGVAHRRSPGGLHHVCPIESRRKEEVGSLDPTQAYALPRLSGETVFMLKTRNHLEYNETLFEGKQISSARERGLKMKGTVRSSHDGGFGTGRQAGRTGQPDRRPGGRSACEVGRA